MALRRTYLDAGVLINAWQGEGDIAMRAMAVLDDPNREFVISDFLRLETLPKPSFHKNSAEVDFMETIFSSAADFVATTAVLSSHAVQLASTYDLSPIDALHVSAALSAKVDDFITSEKSTKPMFNVKGLNVTSLHN